jgi:TM2 domain-containing membrane protein YozV
MTNAYNQEDVSSMKILAGVLGIVLGPLGIHKFVLGYTGAGLVMLLVSVLSLGILAPIMGIIGLIEGIVYLTCPNQRFYDTYMVGEKTWF